MSHANFKEFQNLDLYPKIFWESAEQGRILLAAGNNQAQKDPLFFCKTFSPSGQNLSCTPTWLREIPSAELSSDISLPRLIDRIDLPEKSGWHLNINKALSAIEEGLLNKVVLARKTSLRFASFLDPFGVFLRLRKAAKQVGVLFCVQYEPHKAFLGATPEKLFSRTGRQLTTMAVAGTRRRSVDHAEDEMLAQELLHSAKDRREVDFVADYIVEILSPLCETVEIAPLSILKSARVQHLHYPIRAVLKEGIRDETLMHILHPTPALGGTPRDKALAFIEQHEPFSRESYGAPIGWTSTEHSEVAVAIRSAIIDGCELHLFAGTGIVAGSNANDEWQELEHKISPFIGVL